MMDFERIIAVRTNKTVYRDQDLVIKSFDDDFTKADILNEAMNQARLENYGLNVPKVRKVVVDGENSQIISDYIEGKTLDRLYRETGDINEYIDILAKLHAEVHENETNDLESLTESIDRKVMSSDLSATERFDLHEKLSGMESGHTLCHGDFSLENVIITEDREAYILDWSHLKRGLREADVALSFVILSDAYGEDAAARYLESYGKIHEISEEDVAEWAGIIRQSGYVRDRK